MRKLPVLLLFLSINIINAQYEVQSEYLKTPSKIYGYIDSSATFWFDAFDESDGGFYTNVGKEGNVISSWGKDKDMITQSRDAYGMVRAYMLTGNDEYLEKAGSSLNFMYENAWDDQYSGWINQLDENGNPDDRYENKTAFYQHYALLGIAAYYEATGDTLDWNWLMKTYQNNEEKLWDDDEEQFGYYDYANFNWTSKHGKSFNATVDAITTHVLSLYLMTGKQKYLDKYNKLAQNIMDYLVASMDEQAIGFAEDYYKNWEINENKTNTLMGHVLKTSWCLGRLHQIDPNQEYVQVAEKLFNDVLDNGGYDFEYGGPYKDFNRETGEMLMWGNPDTAKAWWQMEQAITGGLQLYDVTGNEKYLEIADESLQFFMEHFVDHTYGEVYENRTRRGYETWGEHKGNGWKAGYHSIETGYYVYLYANLFLHQKPITLYYNFEPYEHEREFNLTPFAFSHQNLVIENIEHNDSEWNSYNAEERTISLAANEGGEFKVTFAVDSTTSFLADNQIVENYKLSQNYPNPFNPSTKIEFQIPNSSRVTLKVYNVLGEEIQTLVDRNLRPGTHSYEFSGKNLASGIYIYTLRAGDFYRSKKMVLAK